ncbi:MAG: V-type ATPase subunit [Synergistaceae bacterium]|jgi:V/A-type H+-transporting ATPase subunit C|nr:V-type ATPase subunit [Synergistaceae bacterium]
MSVGVKARVLFSRMLSEDDYWSFLSSDTVSEIGERLRGTAYEEALSTLPSSPHRHDLEAAVKSILFIEAESFLYHVSSPRDKFFRTLTYRHEADNLKSIFRYVTSRRTNRDELRHRLYMSKHSRISYDNILAARDFIELSDALRGTMYYKILSEPLKRLYSGDEHSLFPLEMALDIFVELSLYKALKKLETSELNSLQPIFGVRADLYNIYLLYRALKFYDLTPEETLNRLLPVRFRIKMSVLRELSRAGSEDNMADALKTRFPQYAGLFPSALGDEHPQLALERNIKRYIYEQARKVFAGGLPGFHTAVSYYILKEFEIADLIKIIECVRYGYDRRKAAAYLTRPIIAVGGETEWQ